MSAFARTLSVRYLAYGHFVKATYEFTSVSQVTWALQALTKQRGWSELPMYALGASSGGALVLLLALKMPLQVQIMCLTVAGYKFSSCRPRVACLYVFTASSLGEEVGDQSSSSTLTRFACKDSLLIAELMQQTPCVARSYADQESLL